jgi:MOSC domain-containing protein YiiM
MCHSVEPRRWFGRTRAYAEDVIDLPYSREVEIVSLLASPLHRYEGRPADGPRDARGPELHDSIELRAGLGIVGDRYFGAKAHVSASVTVMAIESLEKVAADLHVPQFDPADTRRNIIVRGLDIDALRGAEFTIDAGSGPVLLRANRPANPCAWMDVALAPGAFTALRKRGGMRCHPITSGTISLGTALVRSTLPLDAAVALF